MPKISKIFLLITFVVFGFLVFSIAKAGIADNVSGWAWSENIGWISFNNTTGGGTTNYGVDIDSSTGIFSGDAWSEHIGWISFNESDLTGCPVAPCQAKLDFGTKQVSGWARALTDGSGWPGWIRLRDTNYGVSWNSLTAQMEGWAWSDQVIGWLSFNCKNQNSCATSNYKVVYGVVDVTPPTVSVTGAPASWQNTDATATVSCTDTGTGCDTGSYKLKTYTSNPGTCPTNYGDYNLTSPQTISSHLWVCGTAKDLAGNAGFSSPVEFKVDKIVPSTAVTNPAAGSWHNNDFTATIDDSDTGGSGLASSCQYLVVGLNPSGPDCSSGILSRSCDPVNKTVYVGSPTATTCSATNICIFQGENRCKVTTYAYDNAGNSKQNSRNFSIDWTPPEVGRIACATPPTSCDPTLAPCTTAQQGIEKTFCASLTDPVGQITGCQLWVDGVNSGVSTTISPVPCENGAACGVSANYTFTVSGSHTMKYYCWDAAGNSGFGEDVTVNVGVNHPPVITAGPSYTTSPCISPTTQPGCNVNFTVSATDADGDALTYNWDFGDGESSTEQNPVHHYSTQNTYTVTVIVSDGRGGTDSGNLNIVVSELTLSVNLCAGLDASLACDDSPTFSSPASNVDLKATVSGTMYGTINYKFDCTGDGTYELIVLNQTSETYTAVDLCDYPSVETYTPKVLVERGTGSTQDTATISVVANQPPVCQINVPKTGAQNQTIEIGVANSSDPDGSISLVKFCSDKNAANPNGNCDETWTKGYGWNTPEGDWKNAVPKTMRWSFAETGTYEVWAQVKDNIDLTASCFANIAITTCLPGDSKTCISSQGCNHTLICQPDGTWPVCPADACAPGSTETCDTDGIRTCSDSCLWGVCVQPDGCSQLPTVTCPVCEHPECLGSVWMCQADAAGTDCGDCRQCDASGNCLYACSGTESSCQCLLDSCTDCSNYYDGGCGYQGVCSCGPLEKPVWSCSGAKCLCVCQYDYSCESPPAECLRNYPDVVLSPSRAQGTSGQQLSYTVSVVNNDSDCPSSNFSLTRSCPTGWTCSLDSTNLTISSGQSNSTTLRITSSASAPKGDYQLSVNAENSGTGLEKYSRSGYAIYEIFNNPPTAAISCDASGCQPGGQCGTNWIAYNRNCIYKILNQSTDPDNNIKKSIWSIFYQDGTPWQDPYLTCDDKCDLTLPSLTAGQAYYVKLKVEDIGALSDSITHDFYIRQDAIADFECSLNGVDWRSCEGFNVSENVLVYLRSVDGTRLSIPSEGASLTTSSFSWTFEDGTPLGSTLQNPLVNFKKVDANSGVANLTITDNVGRTDTQSYQLLITVPLPEWREVPPL